MLELKKYRVTILKVTQILSSHRAVYAGLAFCHGSELPRPFHARADGDGEYGGGWRECEFDCDGGVRGNEQRASRAVQRCEAGASRSVGYLLD